MIELIRQLLVFDTQTYFVLVVPSALNLFFALSGVFIYRRKVQALLWSFILIGSAWAVTDFPFREAGCILASLSTWVVVITAYYLIVMKILFNKRTSIFSRSWKQ